MAKKPLPLRIDEDLLGRVDAARGDVSRTRFVERALEAALGERLLPGVQPAPVQTVIRPGSPHAVPSAVPVRPAREFVLGSRQAALNKARKA